MNAVSKMENTIDGVVSLGRRRVKHCHIVIYMGGLYQRSNEMNREQAKSKIRMSVTVNKDYIKSLEKADDVIDQIYDELEELQSRSCGGCKYFRNSDKACFMSSQNTYDRPASIKFSGCGKFNPKEQ